MRIARLVFKDIGPFDDAILAFPEPAGPGELVLFEGPNGSGKTTILEAIAITLIGFKTDLEDHSFVGLQPQERMLRRFRGSSSALDIVIAHGGQSLHLRKSNRDIATVGVAPDILSMLQHGPRESWEFPAKVAWTAFSFAGHQETAKLTTEGPTKIVDSPLWRALQFGRDPASQHLGQLLTNLENERTKALTYARERPEAHQREELERLAASRREAIGRFERAFSEVLDRRVTIAFSIDQQAPEVRFDGELIPLDLLGEGMRSTFSWLSDLLVRLERVPWEDTIRSPLDQDFWLILDEIDESLHPRLQSRILPALRRLLPNARIYATTHSPFVVASVGEGTIFAIRPDKDHRVRGAVTPRRLEPGQSLELVTTEIFDVPADFVDADTRDKLAAHEQDIKAIERGGEVDWAAFLARRSALMQRNDEVRTAVAMQELPVRQTVLRRVREQEEGRAA